MDAEHDAPTELDSLHHSSTINITLLTELNPDDVWLTLFTNL